MIPTFCASSASPTSQKTISAHPKAPPAEAQRSFQDTLSPSIPRAVAGDRAVPEGTVPSGDKRHRCAGLKRWLGGTKIPLFPFRVAAERRRMVMGENTAPAPLLPEPPFPAKLIWRGCKTAPQESWGESVEWDLRGPGRNLHSSLEVTAPLCALINLPALHK